MKIMTNKEYEARVQKAVDESNERRYHYEQLDKLQTDIWRLKDKVAELEIKICGGTAVNKSEIKTNEGTLNAEY